MPTKDIVAKHGIIHPDLYRSLKNEGVATRRQPQKGVQNEQAICAAYKAGESMAAIGRAFGVTAMTVSRILRYNGLSRAKGS